MKSKGSEKAFYTAIFVTIVVAVILGVLFYSGYDLQDWPTMMVITALMLYLQTVVVQVGERMDYSLATAAVFPIIYLFGITPAMVINTLSGLVDGIHNKKEWRRTLFNAAQFAICSLLAALVFQYFETLLGSSGFGLAAAMTLGMLTYILVNILLVSLLVAIWRGISWWEQIRQLSPRSIYNQFSSGFIGLIFTFFVLSYGFWGAVGFGALLINLSGLLKSAAEVSRVRAERKKLEEELVVDELTNAYNFRFLNNWLGELSSVDITVLFIDIDDFAVFNDKYGHATGDKVLRMLVETVKQSVRSEDRVVRYGGDEFVVLLYGLGSEAARLVAERIVANLRMIKCADWQEPITVSVGIASSPHDSSDKHQLLLFADQAMLVAKRSGDAIKMWSTLEGSA